MPQLDWQLGQRLQKPVVIAVAIDAVVAAESFAALPQMMTKVAVVENPAVAVVVVVAAVAAAVAACDVVAGLVAIPVSEMPVSPREN
jgi:hypothetical protein